MPERRHIIPIPFGPGLARNEGSMIVREGALEDVRNWYLQDGRLQTRWGFSEVTTLPGDTQESGLGTVTHILGGLALRSERIGLVVGYSQATRAVGIWRVDGNGQNPEYLGAWFTHHKDEPPIVHIAETNGQVFFAHDEPLIRFRANTIGYGGFGAGSLFLDTIYMDAGESGAESEGTPLKFRGVVGHLDYLFGWGFGSLAEDRPEFVRASLPGQPTVWDINHYWIVGSRRDPVWRCVPGERDLVAFKETQGHAITGTNRANFGQEIIDPLYGLLAPRLAVNVSGRIFFWSNEGPRMTDGFGPSVSLELPLDLPGFEPDDLVAQAALREAFAVYIPQDRMVWFVFGKRVYSLTIRREGDWKWGYHELGFNPLSAFVIWSPSEIGPGLSGPPEGYPDFSSAAPAGTYADTVWTHVDEVGDEILEVWIEVDGSDAWSRAVVEPVSSTPNQTIRADGLAKGITYRVAARYLRGGVPHESYTDSNPVNWPSVSQGTFVTTLNPPVVGVFDAGYGWHFASPSSGNFAFFRNSSTLEDITLKFRIFPGEDVVGHSILLYRSVTGFGESLIATLVEGVDFDLGTLDADGGFQYSYAMQAAHLEILHYFRAATKVAAVESPNSAYLRMFPGPLPGGQKGGSDSPPKNASILIASGKASYEVTATIHKLQDTDAVDFDDSEIKLYDNWDDAGGSYLANPTQLRDTLSITGDLTPVEEGPGGPFGVTGLAGKLQSGTFANPLIAGTLKYAIQFQATKYTRADVSETKTYNVTVT